MSLKRSLAMMAAVALAAALLPAVAAGPSAAQTATEPVCEDIPVDPGMFAGWIVMSVSPSALDESSAETAVTITAAVNGPALDSDATVTLNISEDGATEGVDFTIKEKPLPVITIPAGERTGCVRVHVDPIEDNIDEFEGESVIFDGIHSSGTGVFAGNVLISDNDTVSKVVNLEVTDFVRRISETDCRGLRLAQTSVGTVLTSVASQCLHLPVYVKARLSGSVVAKHDVTVTFGNALGGTASGVLLQGTLTEQQASAYDYIYTASIGAPWSLTIPAGELISPSASEIYSAIPFIIYPIDDADQDGFKTIIVSGSLGTLESTFGWRLNPATIDLLDDESRPAPPTNLRLEPLEGPNQGQVGKLEYNNYARLQWDAPATSGRPAHTSYRLERQIPYTNYANSLTYPPRSMYPATDATSHLDRVPAFSNDYSWVLYAINQNGETASNAVSLRDVENPSVYRPYRPGGL